MKLQMIKKKGKVVEVRPAELTDLEKVTKAIHNTLKKERAGSNNKEHRALIEKSVTVVNHRKTPLEHSKTNHYGYPMYSHNCEATFRIHREYNPKPDGSWGSHRFLDLKAKINFKDTCDPQIANFQDVSIDTFEYIKPRKR